MYIVFSLLTFVFIILGFIGFVGGIPLLVFLGLAIICGFAAVKTYPKRQKGPFKEAKKPE